LERTLQQAAAETAERREYGERADLLSIGGRSNQRKDGGTRRQN
jgi:hypothetical protein